MSKYGERLDDIAEINRLSLEELDGMQWFREKLQRRSWKQSEDAGFHDKPRELGTELMLVVSELAEAAEELRNGRPTTEVYFGGKDGKKPEGFGIELADAVIRIMDTAEREKIDLCTLILQKLAYNKTREYRHGNKAF